MPLEAPRKGLNGATRTRELRLLRGGEHALPAPVEGSRRALNVVVAAILVLGSFPLWVLIAIAIKLTSRGPVIYTQTRIGLDARDTRDRALRLSRPDELPQLINGLRGEINVVGPRPDRPTIFDSLRQEIPNYRLRQRARPGITGHAQVNLTYDSSIDDVRRKVHFDLEYITRQSFWTDIKIMAQTLPVMLFRRGSR